MAAGAAAEHETAVQACLDSAVRAAAGWDGPDADAAAWAALVAGWGGDLGVDVPAELAGQLDDLAVADLAVADLAFDESASGAAGVPAARVGQRLAGLAGAAPSAAVLAELAGLDPGDLDDDQRIDLLVGLERASAWLESLRHRALAAVGTRSGGLATPGSGGARLRASLSAQDAQRWVREEVGAALGLSPMATERRLQTAWALCGDRRPTGASDRSDDEGDDPALPRLPGVFDALAAGEVSPAHTRIAVEHTTTLDLAGCAAVQARVLPRAATQSVAQFTRSVKTAALAAVPAASAERHARARLDRRTWMRPLDDGMTLLCAVLAAEDALAASAALDARAEQSRAALREQARSAGLDWRDLDPGLPALRAYALTDTLRGVLADPTLPVQQGHRPTIGVTIDLPTLLGLAEHPAQLAGYGPIPAPFARALAAEGTWRRLVIDPVTGYLLDYGRSAYEPPAALRDYLLARDVTSRFPYDPRAASRCDLDHAREWADGGATNAANLGALSRRTHTAKTAGCWSLHRFPDGTAVWTSPLGRHYSVPPYQYDHYG